MSLHYIFVCACCTGVGFVLGVVEMVLIHVVTYGIWERTCFTCMYVHTQYDKILNVGFLKWPSPVGLNMHGSPLQLTTAKQRRHPRLQPLQLRDIVIWSLYSAYSTLYVRRAGHRAYAYGPGAGPGSIGTRPRDGMLCATLTCVHAVVVSEHWKQPARHRSSTGPTRLPSPPYHHVNNPQLMIRS